MDPMGYVHRPAAYFSDFLRKERFSEHEVCVDSLRKIGHTVRFGVDAREAQAHPWRVGRIPFWEQRFIHSCLAKTYGECYVLLVSSRRRSPQPFDFGYFGPYFACAKCNCALMCGISCRRRVARSIPWWCLTSPLSPCKTARMTRRQHCNDPRGMRAVMTFQYFWCTVIWFSNMFNLFWCIF